MTALFTLSPVIVISAIGTGWLVTRFKRTLPSVREILNRRVPISNSAGKAQNNPIREMLEADPKFWRVFGGKEGFALRHNNAVCYVQLCQRLERDYGMPRKSIRYVSRRAFGVKILASCSALEQLPRFFFKGFPHLCARFANHYYDDLATRAEGLISHYGPGIWTSYA